MRRILTSLSLFLLILPLPLRSSSQSSQSEREFQPDSNGPVRSVYPVKHSIRTLHAIPGLSIQLVGTSLMPKAHGDAKILGEGDKVNIEISLENMDPADRLGPDYLTYVGWALTPNGVENLGEFVLDGDKSMATSSTQLKSFGLIVTAEPDFAVKKPGDMVVLEANLRDGAMGDRLAANLVARPDPKTPLILREARGAVQLAQAAGAERVAANAFRVASQSLAQAEALFREQPAKTPAAELMARQAVIAAEDARAAADTHHAGSSGPQETR